MFFCYYVLIGVSFVSIVSAESTRIPIQMYSQGDRRLHNKHNLIETYTTPLTKKHHRNHRQGNYHNIQYAPLPLNIQEQYSNEHSNPEDTNEKVKDYTQANFRDNENQYETVTHQERDKKSYLVPQLDSTKPSDIAPRKYIPGYNVDLQAVNKKLTSNEIYASNHNLLVKNKQVNVNLLPEQTINNDENQHTSQNKGITKPPYSMFPYKYNCKDKYNDNNPTEVGKNGRRPYFYVKAPKVQLNLGRTNNFARVHRKASVKVNSNFRKFPSYPREFFTDKKILQSKNTKIYSVKNANTHMIQRNL